MSKKSTANKPAKVAPISTYYVAQLGKAYIRGVEKDTDHAPVELAELLDSSVTLLFVTKEFDQAMRVSNEDDVTEINQFVANAGLPELTWQKVTVNVAAL